jgi:hypothetical protein
VVVARMMPSSVRKLRSLFLRRESSAMRVASQKDALSLNFLETATSPIRRRLRATCSGEFVTSSAGKCGSDRSRNRKEAGFSRLGDEILKR